MLYNASPPLLMGQQPPPGMQLLPQWPSGILAGPPVCTSVVVAEVLRNGAGPSRPQPFSATLVQPLPSAPTSHRPSTPLPRPSTLMPRQGPASTPAIPRRSLNRKRGSDISRGDGHDSRTQGGKKCSPLAVSPSTTQDTCVSHMRGPLAPLQGIHAQGNAVPVHPPRTEEDEDTDSEDEEESILEDLTTAAAEFPMPVKIPSSYVNSEDLQYGDGGQPLPFCLGTATYSYLDATSGKEMFYICMANNSTLTLERAQVQHILRVEGEEHVPVDDDSNDDQSSDLAR
jgi:hypothetical protein